MTNYRYFMSSELTKLCGSYFNSPINNFYEEGFAPKAIGAAKIVAMTIFFPVTLGVAVVYGASYGYDWCKNRNIEQNSPNLAQIDGRIQGSVEPTISTPTAPFEQAPDPQFISTWFSDNLSVEDIPKLIKGTKKITASLLQDAAAGKLADLQKKCELVLQQFDDPSKTFQKLAEDINDFESKQKSSSDFENIYMCFSELFRALLDHVPIERREVFEKTYVNFETAFENLTSKVKTSKDAVYPYLNYYQTPEMKAMRLRWDKYSGMHTPQDRSIVWMVHIHEDGFGDLSNCLNAIRIIRKEYPNWTHRLLIENDHKQKLPFDLSKEGFSDKEVIEFNTCQYIFSQPPLNDIIKKKFENFVGKKIYSHEFYPEKEIVDEDDYDSIKISTDTKMIDEFLNFFESSDLQISVSACVGKIFLHEANLPKLTTNYLSFSEYGGSRLHTFKFDMGLSESCCGIFILDSLIKDSFANPFLNEIFKERENVYFNYGDDLKTYLMLINNLNPDAEEIKIICRDDSLNLSNLDIKGIKKIIYVKDGKETTKFASDKPGKIIRLINPFPLEPADMIRAIHLSQEPVGITGNCTFSESLNRLPFYNNRSPLISFWNGLIKLCETTCPENRQLIQYLKEMQKKVPEKINLNLIGPDDDFSEKPKKIHLTKENLPIIKQQWAELVKIIKKDWNVAKAFLGEINYQLHLMDSKK